MSGWQRLGVVISVLWVLGLLVADFFLIGNHNSRVSAEYGGCMSNTYAVGNPDDRQAQQNQCATYRALNTVTFGDDLLRSAGEPLFFWTIIFAPIAALWIIGGIIIGTFRWIGGGFQKNQVAPHGAMEDALSRRVQAMLDNLRTELNTDNKPPPKKPTPSPTAWR